MSHGQHEKQQRSTGRGRLLILTGPSCAGKSPLRRALRRVFPDLTADLAPVLLHNSRPARPGEADGEQYLFRERATIESLRSNPRYIVQDVRGDLQALDVMAAGQRLTEGDALFEGNVAFARILMTHPQLQDHRRLEGNVAFARILMTHPQLQDHRRLGIFLSPISRDAILLLRRKVAPSSLPGVIVELMRAKLLRRSRRWHDREPSAEELADIDRRAGGAYADLAEAHRFDYVIPNRDGEESDHWDAFDHPIGDARKALLCVATLVRGDVPEGAERWTADLLPWYAILA